MKKTAGVFTFVTVIFFFAAADCGADTYGRLITRGNRYYKSELYDEALDNYTKGEEKNPGVFEPVFNRADALYKSEDYTAAIDAFDRSLDFTKRRHEKADIYYNLGNSHLMVGEYDEAIESYIKGLELNPANLNMKYNLELALEGKKAKEKKDGARQEGEGPQGGMEKTPAEGDAGDNSQKKDRPAPDDQKTPQGESGGADRKTADENTAGGTTRELSKAEAERLLFSVSGEQDRIINDIIRERIRGGETEKDW
ncbi:MAG: tetratricopeptide repeat protein [Spirochaetes bacterium]|nr:tetratricopeptide repeat protein [Spirochaetota bacterium]